MIDEMQLNEILLLVNLVVIVNKLEGTIISSGLYKSPGSDEVYSILIQNGISISGAAFI